MTEPREPLRVLVVEHDPRDAELCLHALERAGFEVQGDVVDLPEQFAERIRTGVYDVVLADYSLPGWTGLDALELLRALGLDVPLILVTRTLGEERAVECLRRGVADYILKQNMAPLPVAVRRALEEASDIAERKQSEEALKEREARFRKIIEASFDGIAITQDGVVLEANQGFAEMFGYTLEEVIGLPVADFIAEESRESALQRIGQHIEGSHELVGKRKDGRKILLEATARTHDIGGRPARVTALRDVTERRTLEEQFRQAEKMDAVGRLAAGVAHDFNNLLTVITSYAEILLGDLAANDARREDVEQIQKAATNAATLTGQLLDFSRQQVIAPGLVALIAPGLTPPALAPKEDG